MSRSGYSDSLDHAELVCWRGAVRSALQGKRGQAFLREMITALDALPEPRLIESELVTEDGCCGLGAVALLRKLNVEHLDAEDRDDVAAFFGIAGAMAAEIAYVNDDEASYGYRNRETPEQRFVRVRKWVVENIVEAG